MAALTKIINQLKTRPHTSDELSAATGLTEIAGRLCEARRQGFEISTTMIEDYSRGFKRRIARYALIHFPKAVKS